MQHALLRWSEVITLVGAQSMLASKCATYQADQGNVPGINLSLPSLVMSLKNTAMSGTLESASTLNVRFFTNVRNAMVTTLHPLALTRRPDWSGPQLCPCYCHGKPPGLHSHMVSSFTLLLSLLFLPQYLPPTWSNIDPHCNTHHLSLLTCILSIVC